MIQNKTQPVVYTTISLDRETRDKFRAVRVLMERRLTKERGEPVRLTMVAALHELMRTYIQRPRKRRQADPVS